MLRETEYCEIFDRLISALREAYPNNEGVTSGSFESTVPQILKRVITEWNITRGENPLALEVDYLGGRKFPDIIINNTTDSEKIGLEVKYHNSSDAWKTLGNSVVASTMEEDVTAIFVLFGHFKKNPPEFKFDLMQNCISGIEITHNPRYMLAMEDTPLSFCEDNFGITYDELRSLPQRDRKVFVNTYIVNNKYDELTKCEDKKRIIAQCFILFPEIFSSEAKERYKRMSVWLFAKGILCRNTRDFISASGEKAISVVGETPIPRVFTSLYDAQDSFKEQIMSIDDSYLKFAWYGNTTTATIPGTEEERINIWLTKVCGEYGGARKKIGDTDYDFEATIKKILDI